LITGHRGFIGSHLSRELSEHGYDVVGHDRQEGDLASPNVFLGTLNRYHPDRVIHLAAQVGRLLGEDDLIRTCRANATMTSLVAKYCGERDIPVLYASTSEVYGDHGEATCFEDERLTALRLPHNLYGLSKLWGEQALRLYAPEGLRVVRLSMPYGPGAPPGRGRRAMDNFCWWAYHRRPITVHRGAERSWCWVGDTVRGIRLVLEQGRHEVYNVGRDDRPISMLALAQLACDLTGGSRTLIREVDPPGRQTVVKRLSTQRLRELGWRPTVELDQGILEVLDWVRRFDAEGYQHLQAVR
jgi:nucleoside-diphosphate-sugar epimerase